MMSMKRKAWVLAALLLGSVLGSVQASAGNASTHELTLSRFADFGFNSRADMINYFTIRDVRVHTDFSGRLTAKQLAQLSRAAAAAKSQLQESPLPGLPDWADINTWITLGQKVWQVIVDNKPVANVSTQRVSVLPMAQQDWAQMESWQGPAVKSFTIEAKNLYGATVMSHRYTVAFNYGGKYNGTGNFLANATIIPTEVSVSWGFTLNSQVEVGTVLNVATKANPTAAVDMQVAWKMDSVLKHFEGRETFFVRGDGSLMYVTGTL